MKILVITYSFEVNPGTFLQAYGVQAALKEIYPNATIELLKHKKAVGNSQIKKHKQKKDVSFLKAKIRAIPRRLKYEYYYRKCFSFSKKSFDLFDYDQNNFGAFTKEYDLIVVGSDTILIKLKGKTEQLGLMWLNGISTPKILFAASAAPAIFPISPADKEVLRRCLNSFKYLGVRDDVTINLFENRIGNINKQITKQLDPTFFLQDKLFKLSQVQLSKFKKLSAGKDVVLINFSRGFKYKSLITNKIKELGFLVVSTHYNEDATYNLMNYNAFQWGGLFKHICFTITDRFHDTIFSLRNNIIVYSIDWDITRFSTETKSSKSSDLLGQYCTKQNHFIIQEKSDVESLINSIEKGWNNIDVVKTIVEKNNSLTEKNRADLLRIKNI